MHWESKTKIKVPIKYQVKIYSIFTVPLTELVKDSQESKCTKSTVLVHVISVLLHSTSIVIWHSQLWTWAINDHLMEISMNMCNKKQTNTIRNCLFLSRLPRSKQLREIKILLERTHREHILFLSIQSTLDCPKDKMQKRSEVLGN